MCVCKRLVDVLHSIEAPAQLARLRSLFVRLMCVFVKNKSDAHQQISQEIRIIQIRGDVRYQIGGHKKGGRFSKFKVRRLFEIQVLS